VALRLARFHYSSDHRARGFYAGEIQKIWGNTEKYIRYLEPDANEQIENIFEPN